MTSLQFEDSKVEDSFTTNFYASYLPYQNWAFPDSIIFYLRTNPTSPKIYQKTIQSCKYFFCKNPVVIVSSFGLEYVNSGCSTLLNGKHIDFNIQTSSSKLWITKEFAFYNVVSDNFKKPAKFLSLFVSKIYRNEIKILSLEHTFIAFKDFATIALNAVNIELDNVTVLNNDTGRVVALEKVIAVIPKAEIFSCKFGPISSKMITSKTVLKMLEIPQFLNLEQFNLHDIPEIFDIENFYHYIKENKKTKIRLRFCKQLSEAYKTRFQTIINEIVSTKKHEYKIPLIEFRRMEAWSFKKLSNLFHRQL